MEDRGRKKMALSGNLLNSVLGAPEVQVSHSVHWFTSILSQLVFLAQPQTEYPLPLNSQGVG